MIFALLSVAVLGWVFNEQANTLVAAPTPEVLAETTVAPTTAAPTTVAPTTVAPTTAAPTTVAPTTTAVPETTAAPTTTTTIPLSDRSLERIESVFGDIAPKSVSATPDGDLFFAQNMMYRHTITVYDERGGLLKTINDQVDLAEFGVEGGGVVRGAPVEAASTSSGDFVYVSNYAMYGPGFGPEPGDSCTDSGWDNSYLYRVDTESLEIDEVIEVGAVPKFLAVSPDDRFVVVSNWCSYDVSIVDTASGQEVTRLDIGRHPRGVAISSDSSTAYVTEMGGTRIAVIPLDEIVKPEPGSLPPTEGTAQVADDWNVDIELDWINDVGRSPRSVVLSPDDQFLYATLNGEGRVIKIDLETREVIENVRTGDAPRSMAISDDGEALYVVNYNSNTMSKVLTSDMEEVQELSTADKPIGITVDPATSNVWVSNYSGVLQIFEDQ